MGKLFLLDYLASLGNPIRETLCKHFIKFISMLAFYKFLKMFVGRAGFEPTKTKVSGVTVRPSWPLWYLPNTIIFKEPSRWRDSNPRPADYKSAALAS